MLGIIESHSRKEDRFLHCGCGNSSLPFDLYKRGYLDQTAVDYSASVIFRMRERCVEERLEIRFLEGDVTAMEFADGSFDVVVDKGTLDAMMCGQDEDVWSPSASVVASVGRYVDHVHRVLRGGGTFLYFTFGQPHFRRRLLQRDGWTLSISEHGVYYSYVLTKHRQ